jgi:hypothetical protein
MGSSRKPTSWEFSALLMCWLSSLVRFFSRWQKTFGGNISDVRGHDFFDRDKGTNGKMFEYSSATNSETVLNRRVNVRPYFVSPFASVKSKLTELCKMYPFSIQANAKNVTPPISPI